MNVNSAKRRLRPLYFRALSKKANFDHDLMHISEKPGQYNHVLLVCIDALRPDSVPDLPLYWSEAVSGSTWTFPSVTSFLTGKYPHEHGSVAHTMVDDDSFAMPEQFNQNMSLPEVFEKYGYSTLGLFGFPMPFMASKTWFMKHRVWADEPAETLSEYYRSWRKSKDKTFAYLHLGDLHAPVEPPQRFIEARDVDTDLPHLPVIKKYTRSYNASNECKYYRKNKLRLYQAALDYVSESLRKLSKDENTLFVLIGDHGEAFWEHYQIDHEFTDSRPNYGVGHGGTPFDKVARVPVGTNNKKLQPSGGYASLIDLPATLIEYIFNENIDTSGMSWRHNLPEDRAVLCEGVRYGPERKAVYKNGKKLIHSKHDNISLAACVTDDGENFDPNIDVTKLSHSLPDSWEQNSEGSTSQMVQDQLEALGYK